jgi:thiamine biosynthesis lipoprotein
MTMSAEEAFCRVEHHMSTAITLLGSGIEARVADRFFDRIRELEVVLSRFRPGSDISRLECAELDVDHADPAVRIVLAQCRVLRGLTAGDFEFEPRHRTGNACDPTLDVNALAKGWIVEEAALVLRMSGAEFLVNAGGDVTASARRGGGTWRVGIQHPSDRAAILGTFAVARGAVATSGAYERGEHIRRAFDAHLTSVTVVGPDLGQADALSTAVFASGKSPPAWWSGIDPAYGLLTVSADDRLRWFPPAVGHEIEWRPPTSPPVKPTGGSR